MYPQAYGNGRHSTHPRPQETGSRARATLPKHFTPPLTCFFWHTRGHCDKSDEACIYAHYKTGHVANAPVLLGPDQGSVAGNHALEKLSTHAEREQELDDREEWISMRQGRLNGKEGWLTRRETALYEREVWLTGREMEMNDKDSWMTAREDELKARITVEEELFKTLVEAKGALEAAQAAMGRQDQFGTDGTIDDDSKVVRDAVDVVDGIQKRIAVLEGEIDERLKP